MEFKKEEFKRNSINVHQRLGTDLQVTQEEMDQERTNTKAYDYLCRLEEAKSWIGRISEIPDSYEEFEEEMRKGVFLAEIAKFYSPISVKSIFVDPILQYRHTDNIHFFLVALRDLGLPKHFYFEVIDLYEKKNFPKVVYCIHALAHYLNTKGIGGGIESAQGRVFSKSDLERLDSEIDKIKMPEFSKIQKDLESKENKEEEEDDLDNLQMERLRKEAEEELLRAGEEDSMEDSTSLTLEDKISLAFKTFLYKKAFDDIYYRKNVSLFSIKKFIFIFFKASSEMVKETEIDELHKKINMKLKDIYDKEMYLEDIENRIKLMISNKLELHNLKPRTSRVEEMNLKPIEGVFHLLITNPKYLSTLLFNVDDKEGFINSTVLPIFSNVSGKKEEYLFINLVLNILNTELSSLGINNVLSNVGSNVLYNNNLSFDCSILGQSSVAHLLMVCYFRSSKEGKLFRDGLYSIVRNMENIEVECNPSEIYKDLFSKEASMDVALENGRVKDIMKTRLMVVRGILSSIVHFVESNIDNIPYILRYFFKVYGIINFFSGFISQFLLAPDAFNSDLRISKSLRSKAFKIVQLINFSIENPEYFGNCHFARGRGEYSKEDNNDSKDGSSNSKDDTNNNSIINNNSISLNDNSDLSYYAPIFPFLRELSAKFKHVLDTVISVSTLDNYFQLESLNELVRIKKSVVYLNVKVVNALILLLRNCIEQFDDSFTNPILTLEFLPDENNVVLSFSLMSSEVCMQYSEQEIATENYLRVTKKKMIYLFRICGGRNIVNLLSKDSTNEEKALYLKIKDEEMSEAIRMSKVKDVDALSCITYPPQFEAEDLDELKESVIDDLKFLESKGITHKANLYSEILTMLAHDIVLLRFMSQERAKELRVNELTYTNLFTKEEYLDMKVKEYDDYFRSYSSKMVSKKQLVYPENSPIVVLKKISVYGSYYFTAEDLMKLSILHQVYDMPDNRDFFFILTSDVPLCFSLEVYINNLQISNPYKFRLEDILYMKKNNERVFDVMGICSFNTNNFVKLLNERYIKI